MNKFLANLGFTKLSGAAENKKISIIIENMI